MQHRDFVNFVLLHKCMMKPRIGNPRLLGGVGSSLCKLMLKQQKTNIDVEPDARIIVLISSSCTAREC